MTLTEFLLARIAEDGADADSVLLAYGPGDLEPMHDRVLAECEAKRLIVERHGPNGNGMVPGGDVCSEFEPWPCDTLRFLALPYADHPDYQQEWKP